MTAEEMRKLSRGAIVRHKHGAESYVVTANYGDRVTLVRTADMTNPAEWDLIPAAVETVPA